MSSVKVLVYDLSRGLASQMSEAILGQRIDGIWHTGIHVFGYEYFFGGGIRILREGMFAAQNSMPHCREHDLGVTRLSRDDLHTYLRTINHLYTQQTYNLITNNCNNFSNTVALYLTGQGIPSYIVDLPRTVFSTPGGMALRPMFEGMQNSIQSGGGSDPFGQYGGVSQFSSSVSGDVSIAPGGDSSSTSISSTIAITPRNPARSLSIYEPSPNALVSGDSDSAIIDNMCKKILNAVIVCGDITLPALSDEEKVVITSASTSIKEKSVLLCSPAVFSILIRLLDDCPTCQLASLFLFRLLVLPPMAGSLVCSEQATVALRALLVRLKSGPTAFSGVPSLVMALCCAANLLTNTAAAVTVVFSDESVCNLLLDAAMSLTSHARVEVRQMSCTVILNLTLACSVGEEGGGWRLPTTTPQCIQSSTGSNSDDDIPPQAVQVLCGALEGVSEESDDICRHRRLSSAARVLRACGSAAVTLAKDIGLDAPMAALAVSPGISKSEREVLDDLILLFS